MDHVGYLLDSLIRMVVHSFQYKNVANDEYAIYLLESVTSCESCLSRANQQIRMPCTLNRGAIIWMFECFLKYSDTNFIGVIDTNNGIYLMSSKFGGDLTLIQLKVYQLLT
ncbi:hypothetical protein PRUPE_4G193700 [Prunus persica]|uniref:Gnk2-homologous domain-containing protein n=1 Tax=Prunus persica TaxID=3760 RepID=M5X5Y8_PRUPE|nr:hypothetical protein PRUPE_4G193700 [Prunus persica]